MSRRRVVVTGLGIVSPVGNTVAETWENILAGKSGIGPITRFDASAFKARIAGEVKGFDVADLSVAQGSAPHGYLHPLRHGGGHSGVPGFRAGGHRAKMPSASA